MLLCCVVGGGFNNILVIGADSLSRYVDWTDRGTCILFGDAAGAVLVQVVFYFFGSICDLKLSEEENRSSIQHISLDGFCLLHIHPETVFIVKNFPSF